MNSAKIATIGAASIFSMVVLLLAYPAMAATQTAATTITTTPIIPTSTALTVGQTITFTSTNGMWHVVTSPTAKDDSVKSGTASGTETLTVTGAFKGGYALTVTSGTISINGTSYTFGSGSAEIGPHQAHLVGQGSFVSTSTTPGSFLFAAGAHANFEGQTYNTLRFDVQVNGQEYGVVLLVTAQVA